MRDRSYVANPASVENSNLQSELKRKSSNFKISLKRKHFLGDKNNTRLYLSSTITRDKVMYRHNLTPLNYINFTRMKDLGLIVTSQILISLSHPSVQVIETSDNFSLQRFQSWAELHLCVPYAVKWHPQRKMKIYSASGLKTKNTSRSTTKVNRRCST